MVRPLLNHSLGTISSLPLVGHFTGLFHIPGTTILSDRYLALVGHFIGSLTFVGHHFTPPFPFGGVKPARGITSP